MFEQDAVRAELLPAHRMAAGGDRDGEAGVAGAADGASDVFDRRHGNDFRDGRFVELRVDVVDDLGHCA